MTLLKIAKMKTRKEERARVCVSEIDGKQVAKEHYARTHT